MLKYTFVHIARGSPMAGDGEADADDDDDDDDDTDASLAESRIDFISRSSSACSRSSSATRTIIELTLENAEKLLSAW